MHNRIETARASHFQARLQLALQPDVLHHLVLAVMLFDQIRPALAAQRRPLPHIRTQIDHTRAELLPEIERVNLQILEFDEHWSVKPPPPPLKLPQRPAEVHTETKVSQGAIDKDKGLKSLCQGKDDRHVASILSQMKSVIVGTAGHIDHGKTALVKALTGIDADRLEEEKRRGITIDIGFAHLELPTPGGSLVRLGFVDVPGHERFVRNMLAGVGGIDLVLLVIAADEGIKPQTHEHFDICRLLQIPRGITVFTKSDAVDGETLEVVRLEVEDYLRGSFLDPKRSPVIAVSALTGDGLDELKRHSRK